MSDMRLVQTTLFVALLLVSPSWGGDPPKDDRSAKAHVDLYGDPLPPGAIARLGTVRFRQSGSVHAVAFSPDGKLIAASSDGLTKVILWDRATGHKIRELPGTGRPHLWALLRFSPDGKRLYGSLTRNRDRKMHVWDVETGTHAKDIPPLLERANVLGYSSDAREVILVDRKSEIVRWDIDKGKERGRCSLPDHDTGIAALVGDRVLVPLFDGQKVSMWDATQKKQLWSAKMTRDKHWPFLPIDFSPDGKLFAFEAPPQGIMVHESISGKLVRQLEADVKKIYYSVAISPDGRAVVGSNMDGTLRIWDLESGQERIQPPPQGGWCLTSFAPDSKTFATSGLVLWETATGKRIGPAPGPTSTVSLVSFSPDGKIAATSSYFGAQPEVRLWDVQTGRPLRSFDAPTLNGVRAVAFAPDGQTLAACGLTAENQVWIWDVRTGRKRHVLKCHEGICNCVAFSADGKRMASGDAYYNRMGHYEGRLCIWDTESGKRLREIRGTHGAIQQVVFTRDVRHLLAAADGVHVYDTDTGQLVGKPFQTKSRIQCLALSTDGRLLATCDGQGPVRLWELATRREIPLKLPSVLGYSVAFAPDGRTLAASGPEQGVFLFLWPSEKTVGKLSGGMTIGTQVFFSPDGRRLATADNPESTALIWDVADLVNGPLPAVAKPTEADLQRWLADLSDADPGKAYKAVWRFVAADKQALPFLAASMQPVKPVDPATVARLIADLDSDQFPVREKASRELRKLGELVEDALRQTRKGNISAEQKRRIDQLLAELGGPGPGAEQLRAIRAVAVLEQIGNAEARKILAALAAGAAGARQTEEAQAALARLKRSEK